MQECKNAFLHSCILFRPLGAFLHSCILAFLNSFLLFLFKAVPEHAGLIHVVLVLVFSVVLVSVFVFGFVGFGFHVVLASASGF